MTPVGGSGDRARAFGGQLVEIHQWLRGELARLREEIGTYADSDTSQHHTSEDTTAFPALGERFPELVPVLEQLQQDHLLVADILRRLQQLLTTVTPDNAEQVRRELDGLTAILESHFQWEERRLVDAFNALQTSEASEERRPRGRPCVAKISPAPK